MSSRRILIVLIALGIILAAMLLVVPQGTKRRYLSGEPHLVRGGSDATIVAWTSSRGVSGSGRGSRWA